MHSSKCRSTTQPLSTTCCQYGHPFCHTPLTSAILSMSANQRNTLSSTLLANSFSTSKHFIYCTLAVLLSASLIPQVSAPHNNVVTMIPPYMQFFCTHTQASITQHELQSEPNLMPFTCSLYTHPPTSLSVPPVIHHPGSLSLDPFPNL